MLSFHNPEKERINPIIERNNKKLPKIFSSAINNKYIDKKNVKRILFFDDNKERRQGVFESQASYRIKTNNFEDKRRELSQLGNNNKQFYTKIEMNKEKHSYSKRYCSCSIQKKITQIPIKKSRKIKFNQYSCLNPIKLPSFMNQREKKEQLKRNQSSKQYYQDEQQTEYKTAFQRQSATSIVNNITQLGKLVKRVKQNEVRSSIKIQPFNYQKIEQSQRQPKSIQIQVQTEQVQVQQVKNSCDNKTCLKSIKVPLVEKYTFFKTLNQKERQMMSSPIKSKQIKQFNLPQESQYLKFIRQYQPLDENFQLQSIIQEPNFRIVNEQSSVFFGTIQNDLKQGSGLLITKKIIFEGIFEKNYKNNGFEKSLEGIFKGNYLNGQRSGIGSYQWYNGQTYEGNWVQGAKEGYGVWRQSDDCYYEGMWHKNSIHGKGKYKHKLSSYEGYFQNFIKQGFGVQHFKNGDNYQGNYDNGKPTGQGKYTWVDGTFYEGSFRSGLREGKGKLFSISSLFFGQFLEDLKHGEGQEFFNEGQYFKGIYKHGVKFYGEFRDKTGILVDFNNYD